MEVSDSSVEFMNVTFRIASIGCVMMLARLLVYAYSTYTCTTVTAQAFNYARASRHTAGQPVRRTSISRLCPGTLVVKLSCSAVCSGPSAAYVVHVYVIQKTVKQITSGVLAIYMGHL